MMDSLCLKRRRIKPTVWPVGQVEGEEKTTEEAEQLLILAEVESEGGGNHGSLSPSYTS